MWYKFRLISKYQDHLRASCHIPSMLYIIRRLFFVWGSWTARYTLDLAFDVVILNCLWLVRHCSPRSLEFCLSLHCGRRFQHASFVICLVSLLKIFFLFLFFFFFFFFGGGKPEQWVYAMMSVCPWQRLCRFLFFLFFFLGDDQSFKLCMTITSIEFYTVMPVLVTDIGPRGSRKDQTQFRFWLAWKIRVGYNQC